MKKIKKWMPALLLALIVAIMPLLLGVPVRADVLSGVPSSLVLDFGSFSSVLVSDAPSSVIESIVSAPGFLLVRRSSGDYAVFIDAVSRVSDNLENGDYKVSVAKSSYFYSFDDTDPSDDGFSLSFTGTHEAFFGFYVYTDFVYGFGDFGDSLVVSSGTFSFASSGGLFSVFSGVGSWLSTFVLDFTEMFFVDGALTFLGILVVAGFALAVILLLVILIAGWLKFR